MYIEWDRETQPQSTGQTRKPDSLPIVPLCPLFRLLSMYCNIIKQCNELCNIMLFEFNSDFKLCNNDEDGCTVKTCVVN